MPIDSSIYFQQQPLDIAGAIDRGLSMRQMLDQRKKQQDMQDAYKAGIVQQPDGTSSFNSNATISDLAKRGYGQEAMLLQKQANEDALNKQKLQKEKNLETANFVASAAPKVKENPQAYYPVFLAEAKNRGLDTSSLPPVWNDDAAKKMDYYHGTALSLMDQHKIDQDKAELGLKQQEFGLKQTGQKLDYGDKAEGRKIDWAKVGLEKQKIANENKNIPQNVYAAATFGKRVEDANNQMNDLINNGYDPTSVSQSVKSKILPEVFKTDNQKLMEQAQRNFVNAILRRESGAAISQSEFDSANKQYFPQVGDSKEVLAQKERNRQVALAGLKSEGEKAWNKVENNLANQNSSNQQAPKTVRMTDKSGRIFDVPAELYGEAIAAGASKVKQ